MSNGGLGMAGICSRCEIAGDAMNRVWPDWCRLGNTSALTTAHSGLANPETAASSRSAGAPRPLMAAEI